MTALWTFVSTSPATDRSPEEVGAEVQRESGFSRVAAGSLEEMKTEAEELSVGFLLDASLLYKETCPELSRFFM